MYFFVIMEGGSLAMSAGANTTNFGPIWSSCIHKGILPTSSPLKKLPPYTPAGFDLTNASEDETTRPRRQGAPSSS
jgi:hypothetical protein